MAYIMSANDFIAKAKDIAQNYNTVYMWAVFGAPVTESIIATKTRQYPSWYTASKQASFRKLIGKDYFGFDCVNLIKAILWGWKGDRSKTWGGATYASNGVPDTNANGMITKCLNVSASNWASMTPGEVVWMSGHIGIYIGDGLAVECTPKWKNRVQITAVGNIGPKAGYNTRTWTKHGKLPWINYAGAAASAPSAPSTLEFKVGDIVNFTGNVHYTTSTGSASSACRPGPAKVSMIAPGKAHPYHLVHTDATSTVYGWVDASTVTSSGTWQVRIKAAALNCRSGPNMNYSVVKVIKDNGGIYTVDQKSGIWLHLADNSGWISSNYTEDV